MSITHLESSELQRSYIGTVKGLHIVANLHVKAAEKLLTFEDFKTFIDREILCHGLCKVGEVYYNFDGGGYTAVLCLTESHLSIHTWPEKNYLTFDVFLSNHLKDNSGVTHLLYKNVKTHFDGDVLFEQIIRR